MITLIKRLTIVLAAMCSFIGCSGRSYDFDSTQGKDQTSCEEDASCLNAAKPEACTNCLPAPYSQLNGQISTWSYSDCTGDWARGVLSQGLPCAQWQTGAVYCVDLSQPVMTIYFKDPNDGVCKSWTLTSEPWFKWTFCGNKPITK